MPSSAPAPLAFALALVAAAAAAAQEWRWHVPHRGAHVYERRTLRFEITPPPSKLPSFVAIHGGASREPHRWRWRAAARDAAPSGFEAPDFDDAAWPLGPGGFGPDVGGDPSWRTAWQGDVICARTTADLGRQKPKALWFRVDHDDGVRIWLNGALVVADDGYGRGRDYVVAGKALDAWRRGDNLVAVRCTDVGGARYLDVELACLTSLPRGVRSAEDVQRLLRDEAEAAGRVRRALFGAYRPPPMLLEGELDDGGQHVPMAPADLRELAWWVATDLRAGALGGAVQLEAPRLYELGDLRLRGRARAVESDGWQTIELTVKSTPEPAAGDDSNRYVDRFVKRYIHHGFDGALTVRRRVEVSDAGARVVAFESDLAGTVLDGEDFRDPAAGVRQQESWRLSTTHENRDAAFRAAVQRSIDRGTARLLEQLKDPNGAYLKSEGPDAANSYHSGRLAIGLLALLKAGVPADHDVVANALAELRRRPLIDTYSLGNALMAIETLYAPESELDQLRAGTIDRPQPRRPSAEDRALLQRWTDRLSTNVDTRVDRDQLLRFNYTEGARFDNSVHQYGLLGLYSAHLCGVEVPPVVFEAAANHLLDAQSDAGRRLQLELVDQRTFARQSLDPTAAVTSARTWARTNGWGYYGPKDGGEDAEIFGSMTCAGITGLAICEGALSDFPDVRMPKLFADARRARDDGFAWLAAHLTVRHHPGALTRQHRWFYYYLYSLERAARLSGVALIQDRDWYFEGALVLALAQQDDGHWPGELSPDLAVERNAMAILFLKQSTRPVLTGR